MKWTIILLFSFLSSSGYAQEKSFLAKYYDCASSTNFFSDLFPVFIKVDGKKIKNAYRAGVYTRGIDIALTASANNDVQKIHFGKKVSLGPNDLAKGLEFGVANLTAHTIQLVNFDPEDGGALEFGFLKTFKAKKKNSSVSVKDNLNQYYTSVYGDLWGTHKVYLVKNKETGKWSIQDKEGSNVSALFGVMKITNKFLVSGITEMITIKKDENFDFSGNVIIISNGQKSFECEI